ncbi:unnamed protein product [Anisakis simplex]|uniref:Secreted protein n=1 Tax=Anisakis simplex TaxID=6269 RepID=A0A0M3JX68_ANISI|nr:unnamed protein product [Anisakis simplex]
MALAWPAVLMGDVVLIEGLTQAALCAVVRSDTIVAVGTHGRTDGQLEGRKDSKGRMKGVVSSWMGLMNEHTNEDGGIDGDAENDERSRLDGNFELIKLEKPQQNGGIRGKGQGTLIGEENSSRSSSSTTGFAMRMTTETTTTKF